MGNGLKLENLSPDFVRLNRDLLERAGLLDKLPQPKPEPTPPPPCPVPEPQPAPASKRKVRYGKDPEKKLQADCRNLLIHRGYVELTPTNLAQRAADAHGWFGHMVKPQGNPIMPDLFVFDASQRRCLMVELKTHNVYQVGQKEMIDAGCWKLATDAKGFLEILENWEKFQLPGREIGARESPYKL